MADTNNIYQRAIDIFNKHVEPDIYQGNGGGGGGGGGGPQYMHKINMRAVQGTTNFIKFGKEASDRKECKFLVNLAFAVELPFDEEFTDFDIICMMIRDGYIKNPIIGSVGVYDVNNTSTKKTDFPIIGVSYESNDGDRLNFHYSYFDWDEGQIDYTYNQILETDQMEIYDVVEEINFG